MSCSTMRVGQGRGAVTQGLAGDLLAHGEQLHCISLVLFIFFPHFFFFLIKLSLCVLALFNFLPYPAVGMESEQTDVCCLAVC